MAHGPQKLRFGGDCEGFLQLPRGEAPAGAVVILHERYGLVQHTFDLAQRLARDGYVALAPDLFSRWRGDREALRRGEARVTLPDRGRKPAARSRRLRGVLRRLAAARLERIRAAAPADAGDDAPARRAGAVRVRRARSYDLARRCPPHAR